MSATTPRSPGHHRRFRTPAVLAVILLLVLVPVGILFILPTRDTDDGPLLDADLCPTHPAAVAGHAVLLLDLRKPLGRDANLLRDVLQAVSRSLGSSAELRVFTITSDPVVPRLGIDRLCKPYDDADLQVAAAKDAGGVRDCDDLPAQMPAKTRERAALFCARREALTERVALLAEQKPVVPVANAYLIEAIEDTLSELAEATNPSLHIFSDMVQHSPWYSHAERGPNKWGLDEFARARAQRTEVALSIAPPPNPYLNVRVFYLRRLGLTDQPRIARAHKQFWRSYFADFVSLEFDDLPVSPAYEVQRLGDDPNDAQVAAADAERTRRDLEEARQLLAQAEKEKAALEAARLRAEEDAREAELRRRELEAQATAQQEAESPPSETGNAPAPTDAPPAVAVSDAESTRPGRRGEEPSAELLVADVAVGDLPEPEPLPVQPVAEAEPQPGEPDSQLADDANWCAATLRPGFAEAAGTYPNRGFVNYGSADIVVAFVIDETGETIDDEVAFVPAESDAERSRHLDLFSRSAEQSVRTWVFDFDSAADCVKRQEKKTRISFRYRR